MNARQRARANAANQAAPTQAAHAARIEQIRMNAENVIWAGIVAGSQQLVDIATNWRTIPAGLLGNARACIAANRANGYYLRTVNGSRR